MRKFFLLLAAIFFASIISYSQTSFPKEWYGYLTEEYYYSLKQEVCKSDESEATLLEKLLASARMDLASQIKINVSTTTTFTDSDINGKAETEYIASSNFSTDVTLRFVESRTYYDKRKKEGFAIAFISKEELDDIYKARALKVKSMLDIAKNAEKERKFDAALKYNYWSILLNSTLPINYQPEYQGQSCQWWARSRIEDILSSLQFTYSGRTEDDPLLGTLEVAYNGLPVTSLDYTYNDGLGESAMMQVRDGIGVIEFRSNIETRNIDVKVEYSYEYESNSDPEMKLAMAEVGRMRFAGALKSGVSVRDASSSRASKKKKKTEQTQGPASASTAITNSINGGFSKMSVMQVKDSTYYLESVNKVLDAIQAKDYARCRSLFSDEGYDIYERLIHYGNARIIRRGPIKCLFSEGTVYCRSIPMQFSFKNNVVSFLENIVFAFDQDGKIGGLSFALEAESIQDILSKTKWEDTAKMVLITFLESYKTSFALKNLEYISSVFSDDALIITGRKVKRTVMEGGIQLSGDAYVYNRQTKTQYLRNLSRSFASKEYINLKFSNVSVLKTTRGTNNNLFGIQVRQDYFSSNYGDSGYLYLLVDIADHTNPLIYVRTWQPEPDPEFGIYGINNL